ncbi:MAG: PDZ domain-containing protein, partial [Victivallales bacterium]|nr:PDZ domain-containing protein [Victivallales bacterium]
MKRKLTLTLAFALLVNLIIGYTAYSEERENVGGDDEVLANIETIMHVLQLIRRNYVDIDKVSTRELLEGALNGMTEKLDQFSAYLPPSDLKSLMEDTEGAFGGIGVNVNTSDDKVHIVATTPDAPGEKAGLQAGDIITAVDDKPMNNADLENAALRLRGKPGTQVKVTVWRQSEGKTLDFNITRAMIPLPNVTNAQVIEGTTIGFVRVR